MRFTNITPICLYINKWENLQTILNQLIQYVKHKRLPAKTAERLVTYYTYNFQGAFFNEDAILQNVPYQLRHDIVMFNTKHFLREISFFTNLPSAVIWRMVNSLHKELYLADDNIITAGDVGTCMYFIASGTVAVYSPSGTEICHLRNGEYFGEIALCSENGLRTANVVAVEVTEVYRLVLLFKKNKIHIFTTHRFDENDFNVLLRPIPDILEKLECSAIERYERMMFIEQRRTNIQTEKVKAPEHFCLKIYSLFASFLLQRPRIKFAPLPMYEKGYKFPL